MADFRKLLFVLIAGALLFTTVASADPFSCAITPTQTLVRQEGLTDYVGDIVLNCFGDVPNPAVGIRDVNIRVTMNNGVNITSNLLNSATPPVTEATMIMDEGWQAGGRVYKGYSTAPTVPYSDGSQNIFQAIKIADNAVEWQGVVVAAPGSNPFKVIRLTNIRVNSAGLPVGTAITAYVNITSPTSFPILNTPTVTVANVAKAMTYSVTTGSWDKCVLPPTGENVGHFHLIFTEGFGSAFKVIGSAISQNNIPGGNYPNESGFSPGPGANGEGWGGGQLVGFTPWAAEIPAGIGTPAVPAVTAVSSIGQANNATLLLARIKNIPLGIAAIGFGGSVLSTGTVVVGGMTVNLVASAIATDRSATITGTVASVTGSSLYLPDIVSIQVELKLDYTVPAPRGVILTNGTLAPVSTVGVMSVIDPEPRFIDTGTPDVTAFTFSGVCHTLLLFPYLTNQAGFDTGIVIANTSVDFLGTAPQDGACTLNYYGFVGGHLAVPVLQTGQNAGVAVSPTVPGGAQLIMLLSAGGGSVNPLGAGAAVACATCAPISFQGYMIASCNFQFAHGYAFVSDTGATKLAQGYLALVIPERFYQASPSTPPITLRLPQHSALGAFGNQGEQLGN